MDTGALVAAETGVFMGTPEVWVEDVCALQHQMLLAIQHGLREDHRGTISLTRLQDYGYIDLLGSCDRATLTTYCARLKPRWVCALDNGKPALDRLEQAIDQANISQRATERDVPDWHRTIKALEKDLLISLRAGLAAPNVSAHAACYARITEPAMCRGLSNASTLAIHNLVWNNPNTLGLAFVASLYAKSLLHQLLHDLEPDMDVVRTAIATTKLHVPCH